MHLRGFLYDSPHQPENILSLAHEMFMSKFFEFKAIAADISGVALMPVSLLVWSANCYLVF